jgi:hypothetical protein
LADAEKKTSQAEKEAAALRLKAEEAEALLKQTMEAAHPGIDREEMAKIEAAVEAARKAAVEAHTMERKAAKAKAKVVFSQRHAESLGAFKDTESRDGAK